MQLSETAREILDLFRTTHRKPGARVTMVTLGARFGSDPAIAVSVSELTKLGLVIAPDADTIELTPRGFDMIQRGSDRQHSNDSEP